MNSMHASLLFSVLVMAGCFQPNPPDGVLACNPDGKACPDGYECIAGRCFHEGSSFTGDAESDCFDGQDNNGDGLADCDDPTCADVSQCEVDPGVGTMGNLTSDACPTNYGAAQVLNQSLTDGDCDSTGCYCSAVVRCNTTSKLYPASTGCTSTVVTSTVPPAAPNTSEGPCVPVTNQYYKSSSAVLSGNPVYSSCTSSGSSPLPTPTWGTSSNFCPITRKGACAAAGKVCVPKYATGRLCVELSPGETTCPAGYSGSSATWYSGYSPGSCSCGCNLTSAICTGYSEVKYFSDSNCANMFAYNTSSNSSCEAGCCDELYYYGIKQFSASAIAGIKAYSGQGSGTCSATPTRTASTPTPVGGIKVCCK